MKDMIKLLLFFALLVFTVGCQEEEKTTPVHYDKNTTTLINIHGKTDKRLRLDFYVSYRPKYFPKGKVSSECKEASLHPSTATKRRKVLHRSGATIKNQDEYNVTFPIFNKLVYDKCQSTPVGISVQITRLNEKDGLYARVPIYTDTPLQTTEKSMASGNLKVAYRAEMLKKTGDVSEPPKYFRVKDGARVECYTKHYEKDVKSKEHIRFRCELPYKGNATWKEIIKDDNIHLDIVVDNNKSYYYPTLFKMKNGNKGHTEPFQEVKLNIFDKIKQLIQGE